MQKTLRMCIAECTMNAENKNGQYSCQAFISFSLLKYSTDFYLYTHIYILVLYRRQPVLQIHMHHYFTNTN